jgi:hypothetical protein
MAARALAAQSKSGDLARVHLSVEQGSGPDTDL